MITENVAEVVCHKITKASFAGCPLSDRKEFPESNAILPISIMGRKEHEGHRFAATLKLVNSSFQSCTLLVVDSLYRHTLKIDHPMESEPTLYQMALEAGKNWLYRNRLAYEMISIPHQIKRWDEYLNHSRFNHYFDRVSALYNTDLDYSAAIHANVEEYLQRYSHRKNGEYPADAFQCSANYLLEECAGMCLWAEEGYNFEVYPTGRCLAMVMTYKKLIQDNYPSFLRPVSIRFKKTG